MPDATEVPMQVSTFRTAGLGDSSYLLAHDGLGLLIDPQRDIGRFLEAADDAGVQVRWVLETHVHNDYVSGGRAAAARAGAELIVPAGAGVAFDHTPGFHREEFSEGSLSVRPLHTPGHTPEHVAYLALVDGEPRALFSGGSLLVGSAGRCDLLGADRARGLARAQHHSVHRLADLPDAVGLYPTHGQGSFCTSSGAGRATSTIGEERRANPVLAYPDSDAFVAGELEGLLPYPRYYAHVGPVNREGPEAVPETDVPELSVDDMAALDPGVAVVDLRPRQESAAGHVPGALCNELSERFGVWVGWLVEFNAPLALVASADSDVGEAVTQLARIGFDRIRGVFRDMRGWSTGGQPVASYGLESLEGFLRRAEDAPAQVLDVRDPSEHAEVRLRGAAHRYLPDLVDQGVPASLDPAQPVFIACATGYRSAMAASLLLRAGYRPVVLDDAGVGDIVAARRRAGETPWGAPPRA